MIRVKCPGCQRKLSVNDPKAGAIATCPVCKQRFLLPAPPRQRPAEPDDDGPSEATPRRKPAKQGAAKQKAEPEPQPEKSSEPEDLGYRFVEEPEEPAGKKKRPPVGFDEPDESGLEQDRPKRKRKKRGLKKKRKSPDDISLFQVLSFIVVAMILIWSGVAALVYFLPGTWFIVWMLLRIIAGVCVAWVRYLAREEGCGTLLMMIFVPFYDIYFAFRFPREAAMAVVVQYFAVIIMLTALAIHYSTLPPPKEKPPDRRIPGEEIGALFHSGYNGVLR